MHVVAFFNVVHLLFSVYHSVIRHMMGCTPTAGVC